MFVIEFSPDALHAAACLPVHRYREGAPQPGDRVEIVQGKSWLQWYWAPEQLRD
jgi:hypothetical protein